MTFKEYYHDPFSKNTIGKVINILENGIIFDKTIAFPEGGGQIGDSGKLIDIKTNEIINFFDTTKKGGRKLNLSGFPEVHVESDIVHHIISEDLDKIRIGAEYEIIIDDKKRAHTTINHSGIHVVLMAIEQLRPGMTKKIFGAKISEKSARVDFITEKKFTQNELLTLTNIVNNFISEDHKIETFPHPDEQEALYWKCNNYQIPCGGTHLTSTKALGKVRLKRKNLGKTSDRVIAFFENSILPEYH